MENIGNSDEPRFPRRTKKAINYKEDKEPDDDRWIYCDECRSDVVDWCRRCGRLARLRDAPAPPAGAHALRARLTLPACLRLADSPLHGVGVFAAAALPRGLRMGPYEGKLVRADEAGDGAGGYSWRMRDGRLVDAADEAHSNWMRFVNCAPHAARQNLVGFQYRGALYYRTVAPVAVDEELLVYYGDDYARNIGVDVDGYYDYDPPGEDPEPEVAAASDGDGDASDDGGPDVGYDCSHCGISLCTQKFKVAHEFRCKIQMKRKELESQVTELFHCGYCRCPFLKEDYMKKHQQRWCRKRPVVKRKDSNGTYFGCDKCEFVTKRKWDLGRHLLTHNKHNAEWFTCTQCSYKTVHKGNMTGHMKRHRDIFSCCCPICGKSFRTKRELDDHLLRQHSDESDEVAELITNKVYTCNICDRFRTTLKTHFNTHLTITHLKGVGCQKYECPRCPYSTFRKPHLARHSKTHTGQMDYRCTGCKKQFSRKRHLHSHILFIHSDNVDLVKTITSKIHTCELCSFKTVRTSDLKRHMQSKHA